MSEIRIGSRLVGDGCPTYVIAEIGVNHNGILDYAYRLIDASVVAGADAVKFQKRSLKQLYPEEFLNDANVGEKNLNYLLPILQEVELSEGDFRKLALYCEQKGVTFLCSAFDAESAEFVNSLGVPAFKVASADMINLPLLGNLTTMGKPLIVSTGMSRWDEVVTTVEFLKQMEAEFALLHCNSTYPAAFEDINLRFMDRLREFGVPVGYSGHERGIAVSTVASALGAAIIERHITLDRTMAGPDHAASLEPQGFEKMVRDIRHVSSALGSGKEKYFTRGEILNREVLAKSLVAARSIEPGETIDREMVTVKGPGQGLSPQALSDLVGRVTERAIKRDDPFVESDLGSGIGSGIEYSLPMEWGLIVRYKDYESALQYSPKVLEFHFTDKDLEDSYPGGNHGVKLVVHAPEFWGGHLVDLCAFDEDHRQASTRLVQKSIDVTRGMAQHFVGTPKVVVHPGAASLDQPISDRAGLYDNLRRSIEALDFAEVELLLENLPPRPWYFGGQWITNAFMDAFEIREFLDSTGLRTCFDSSHCKLYCNTGAHQFEEQVAAILPYVSHLHLSDASGLDGEGLQIGDGTIDWVAFFKVIGDYHGTMIPEIWRGHQRGSSGFILALNRLAESHSRACEESTK